MPPRSLPWPEPELEFALSSQRPVIQNSLFGFGSLRVFNGELKMTDSQKLLADFIQNASEPAFSELVARYVGLVYSAAFRVVQSDAHRAEDVTQIVFTDLARMARTLSKDVMLGGWLHRHTCFVAAKIIRGEQRRQTRERQAVEMIALIDHSEADLTLLAPILDEAINQLGDEDRTAILLRFFEQLDFRSVGEALGSSEDAARMRVTRALGKLHSLLQRRGITAPTAAISTALSANAIGMVPAGLAAKVSTAALAGAAIHSSTVIAATKTIAMTTLQKTLITATIAVVSGTGIYEVYENSRLHDRVQTLQQQQAPLTEQIQQLQQERDEAARQLAASRDRNESLNRSNTELLRLRGEVGVLRQQTNELAKLLEEKVKLPQTSQAETQIMDLAWAKDLYIRAWLQAFSAYAREHQGQCPEHFQQAASFLPDGVRAISQTADQFEILYHGSLDSIQGQDIIVFREKSLWQHVGGKWGRFYGIADGHAQYCSSSDKTATGSFDSYEIEHIIPSPSQ